MSYKPLVFVDEAGEVFPPRSNPYPKRPRPRFVSAFSPKGLRVEVALVREPGFSLAKAPVISQSESAARVIDAALADEVQESFGCLLLDGRNKVTGVFIAHRGTVASVLVSPADVLRPALVAGAASIIIFHNHPSGDVEPSEDDQQITRRIEKAAEVLGLKVLDHIILGEAGNYYSFADRGLL